MMAASNPNSLFLSLESYMSNKPKEFAQGRFILSNHLSGFVKAYPAFKGVLNKSYLKTHINMALSKFEFIEEGSGGTSLCGVKLLSKSASSSAVPADSAGNPSLKTTPTKISEVTSSNTQVRSKTIAGPQLLPPTIAALKDLYDFIEANYPLTRRLDLSNLTLFYSAYPKYKGLLNKSVFQHEEALKLFNWWEIGKNGACGLELNPRVALQTNILTNALVNKTESNIQVGIISTEISKKIIPKAVASDSLRNILHNSSTNKSFQDEKKYSKVVNNIHASISVGDTKPNDIIKSNVLNRTTKFIVSYDDGKNAVQQLRQHSITFHYCCRY